METQTLTVAGRFDNLAKIREFAARAAERLGFGERGVYHVKLCVDEACSNIIEHAYGGEDRGDIQCALELHPDRLVILLRDWGRSFDPSQVPNPDFSKPIEEASLRGAGLYLMRELMDQVEFSFSDEEGNLLRLVKSK